MPWARIPHNSRADRTETHSWGSIRLSFSFFFFKHTRGFFGQSVSWLVGLRFLAPHGRVITKPLSFTLLRITRDLSILLLLILLSLYVVISIFKAPYKTLINLHSPWCAVLWEELFLFGRWLIICPGSHPKLLVAHFFPFFFLPLTSRSCY